MMRTRSLARAVGAPLIGVILFRSAGVWTSRQAVNWSWHKMCIFVQYRVILELRGAFWQATIFGHGGLRRYSLGLLATTAVCADYADQPAQETDPDSLDCRGPNRCKRSGI